MVGEVLSYKVRAKALIKSGKSPAEGSRISFAPRNYKVSTELASVSDRLFGRLAAAMH